MPVPELLRLVHFLAQLAGLVGEWDLRNCFMLVAGFSLLSILFDCVIPFAAHVGKPEPASAGL